MAKSTSVSAPKPVRVWDPATRLFHWALVCAVGVALYTAEFGGYDSMDLHALAGFSVLALVLFRLFWGVIGSRRSRFGDFVRGPRAVIDYARRTLSGDALSHVGHNPLGGWSVVAMLGALLLQAMTGLFSSDDVLFAGPLASRVSGAMSEAVTEVHESIGSLVMILIAVHLAAIVAYYVKGENLLWPMIVGRKTRADGAGDFPFVSPVRAIVAFALAAALVAFVVAG